MAPCDFAWESWWWCWNPQVSRPTSCLGSADFRLDTLFKYFQNPCPCSLVHQPRCRNIFHDLRKIFISWHWFTCFDPKRCWLVMIRGVSLDDSCFRESLQWDMAPCDFAWENWWWCWSPQVSRPTSCLGSADRLDNLFKHFPNPCPCKLVHHPRCTNIFHVTVCSQLIRPPLKMNLVFGLPTRLAHVTCNHQVLS